MGNTSIMQWVLMVAALTGGSMLLMWLGELITEQGIGNGISLLIFGGIVSQLPKMMATIGSALFDTSKGSLHVFNWFTIPVNPASFWVALGLIIASVIILYILVKINEAQRIIVINYAKRVQGNSSYGGVRSILPVKLISANVVPIIFAVAFMSLPAFIGQILKASGNPAFLGLASNLISWFQAPSPGTFTGSTMQAFIYPAVYFVLVIAFTYFYTGIIFNSNEIAENLQKQGGFIEGVRPGQQTEDYLTKIVNRLTLFGSLALGLIAIMPFVGEYLLYNFAGITGTKLSIGGTGLLIVVSVALESLRQINSRALMVTYDEYE
jgi:preprotein translocase subunit SecY